MYAALAEKRRRHCNLRRLLTERGFRSHAALATELERFGHHVHRTTVGEDLRELGATFRRRGNEPMPSWHITPRVEQERLAQGEAALDRALSEAGLSARVVGDEYVLVLTRPEQAGMVAEAVTASELTYEQAACAGPLRDDLVLVQLGETFSTPDVRPALEVADRLARACNAGALLQAAG